MARRSGKVVRSESGRLGRVENPCIPDKNNKLQVRWDDNKEPAQSLVEPEKLTVIGFWDSRS